MVDASFAVDAFGVSLASAEAGVKSTVVGADEADVKSTVVGADAAASPSTRAVGSVTTGIAMNRNCNWSRVKSAAWGVV